MNVQIIRTPQGEEMAVLPKAEYDALIEAAEDREDIEAVREIREKIAAGEAETVPFAMAERILDGESTVRVWREYRGISAKTLAENIGISAPYLSQIERGVREGSLDVMRKISDALNVTIDDLI